MVFSHGLGGSRDGFGYLGEHWADAGYVVIALQHPGSDISIFADRKPNEKTQEIMQRTVNAQTARDRYDDVVFVLDHLERIPTSNSTLPELDLDRIGLAGHSFGSQTTLALVGRLPYKADSRVKAAVVFSPNRTQHAGASLEGQKKVHKAIRTPIMHFTGTHDTSPMTRNFDPKDRQIPFQSILGAAQYLLVFDGGNHMLFSGHKRPFGLSDIEKRCQPLIAEMTRRFFDAYLQDDEAAKKWLHGKGLAEMMQGHGTVTMKHWEK